VEVSSYTVWLQHCCVICVTTVAYGGLLWHMGGYCGIWVAAVSYWGLLWHMGGYCGIWVAAVAYGGYCVIWEATVASLVEIRVNFGVLRKTL
jgi:hypothetical protein